MTALLALLVALAPPPDGSRLAIAPILSEDEALDLRLTSAIEAEARAAKRYDVVAAEPAASQLDSADPCAPLEKRSAPECLEKFGGALRANVVLVGSVLVDDRSQRLVLRMFDMSARAFTGQQSAAGTGIARPDDLAQLARILTRRLLTSPVSDRGRATLKVPQGGRVLVDGVRQPSADVPLSLAEGTHQLKLELPGSDAESGTFDVLSGEAIGYDLVARRPAPHRRRLRFDAVQIAVLAVFAVSAGTLTAALIANQRGGDGTGGNALDAVTYIAGTVGFFAGGAFVYSLF